MDGLSTVSRIMPNSDTFHLALKIRTGARGCRNEFYDDENPKKAGELYFIIYPTRFRYNHAVAGQDQPDNNKTNLITIIIFSCDV